MRRLLLASPLIVFAACVAGLGTLKLFGAECIDGNFLAGCNAEGNVAFDIWTYGPIALVITGMLALLAAAWEFWDRRAPS